MCRELGITNYSAKKKLQLIELINSKKLLTNSIIKVSTNIDNNIDNNIDTNIITNIGLTEKKYTFIVTFFNNKRITNKK